MLFTMNRRVQSGGQYDLEALEPRLLLSADPMCGVLAAMDGADPEILEAIYLPVTDEGIQSDAVEEGTDLYQGVEDEALPVPVTDTGEAEKSSLDEVEEGRPDQPLLVVSSDAFTAPVDESLSLNASADSGNILTEQMVNQLEMGMTREQVRYLLGTPLLTDMFHTDRWDYIYTIKRGHKPMETKRLTLWFEEDQLASIKGFAGPDPSAALAAQQQETLIVDVPDWRENRGIFTRTLNAVGVETAE